MHSSRGEAGSRGRRVNAATREGMRRAPLQSTARRGGRLRDGICRALCFAGAFALVTAGCGPDGVDAGREGSSPVPVRVARVSTRDVPVEVRAVGNVEPYSTVEIKSRIAGQVAEVKFKEGDRVHEGDLLFSIDSRPFEASLNEATATLARDVAQEKLNEAQASREQRLFSEGVSSRDSLDVAKTRVSAQNAVIEADRAAVESARLYLSYCAIHSPIDGIIGEIVVHAGNIVKENETTLATIRQHVPVYVRFAVPERHLTAIREHRKRGALRVTAAPSGDASASPDSADAVGELSFVDNTVDELTGTILLKGLFPNRDERLWPGQFVDAALTLATRKNAVVVPDRALVLGQSGRFAFVVREDHTVESRPVVSSSTEGGLALIEKGLSPGEIVVVDGQLRLVSGSRVTIIEDTSRREAAGGGAPARSVGGGSSDVGPTGGSNP